MDYKSIIKSWANDLAPVYFVTKRKGCKATDNTINVWRLNEMPNPNYMVGAYKWGYTFEQTKDVNWLIIHFLRALKIDF